jgi:3-phenylpropionate/cinnamic acid dioxygenase small subunit
MALRQRRTKPSRATGHVSHDAQVRIDERVAQILARRASDRPAAPTTAHARTRTEVGTVGIPRKR